MWCRPLVPTTRTFSPLRVDLSAPLPPPLSSPQSGPIVIDNSSAWRMDPNVPLVVPEINMDACKGKKLIANPNCTTAIALMALYPLHKEFGIKKCIVSTYQARRKTARTVVVWRGARSRKGRTQFIVWDLAERSVTCAVIFLL